MHFIPSSYGGAEAPLPADVSSSSDYAEYFAMAEQAAPAFSALLFGKSDREQLALLEARIENFKMLRSRTRIQLIKDMWTLQIKKMQARADALRRDLVEIENTEATYKYLQAGSIVLTGLLALLLVKKLVS